jgi:hypothetical protein
VPLRTDPEGQGPGGRRVAVYRLISSGVISWGDSALLMDELAEWGKTHGDFNRGVAAAPFYAHLTKDCSFPADKISNRIAYALKHGYLLTDPEIEPYAYLMMNDRMVCEQEFIHRIAHIYREHLGLKHEQHKKI